MNENDPIKVILVDDDKDDCLLFKDAMAAFNMNIDVSPMRPALIEKIVP